jgi:hypothetical protein
MDVKSFITLGPRDALTTILNYGHKKFYRIGPYSENFTFSVLPLFRFPFFIPIEECCLNEQLRHNKQKRRFYQNFLMSVTSKTVWGPRPEPYSIKHFDHLTYTAAYHASVPGPLV